MHMKKTSKRFLAALLAVLTVFSMLTVVTAFAAETAESAVADQGDPVVGNITGLKKTTTESDRIRVEWNPVDGASGYAVAICDADKAPGTYADMGDTTNTYMGIKGLRQGIMHIIRVNAFVMKDGNRYDGEPVFLTTATQPNKISGLVRTQSSDTVTVKWNVNANVTGYKVFRADGTSGNFALVKEIIGKTNNSYSDKNVKLGKIYTYKVVGFRQLPNGNRYHSAGTTIACMSGLCAPNFNISSQLYRVNLSWKRNAYATRYDIYYSADKNATAYTKAGSTTGTSFVTGKLPAKKLYFRVYPIYKGNVTVTGTAHTKEITVSSKINNQSVGSTYVEISISQQRMWLYKDGKVIVDTPVVTGTKGSMDTPKGYFTIYSKAKNTTLYGPGYASPVDYWMAFSGGCGIHDASWRSSFGGSIYTYNGSHGCVNTPYNAVRTIYNNTSVGTPVIVY